MEPATNAALLKLGIATVERMAPKGIAFLKNVVNGRTVLVVGHPRAGKSTLIDYLQYGIFGDEKETAKTPDIRSSARFDIRLGRDKSLELKVKTVLDIPGQIGPVAHANLVFEKNPHAVLMLIDLTRSAKGSDEMMSYPIWVEQFCDRLEMRWAAARHRRKRLKTFMVILTKRDKVSPAKEIQVRRKIRDLLNSRLQYIRAGLEPSEIPIRTCVLVTNANGTKGLDAAIEELAKSVGC